MEKDTRHILYNTAIITTIIYIIIAGIGMFLMHHVFNYSYNEPSMAKVFIFAEIVLAFLTIFVTVKFYGWKNVGFGRIRPKQLLWMIVQIIVIFLMVSLFIIFLVRKSNLLTSEDWNLIGIILITTLLVGISEELMFRGILLSSLKRKLSISKAILISAICFSLLHSVNILGGLSFNEMLGQLLNTFIFGIFFSSLAIKLNNIIPLMIYHWLWDFVLISSPILNINMNLITLIVPLANLLIGITLWIKLSKAKNEY